MVLTDKQEQALKIAVERYRMGEKFTVISGYAGSGKSTVVRFIVQALEVDPEQDVAYCAFTGKAAKVLAQKGCPNAVTAHKLLYEARPKSDGTFFFLPKISLEQRIIIVDEVSMLPAPMWNLLLSHDVYILACGDPGQLPPINPDDDNHVLDHPHVFLDEIMRQAQESEIIRLSMHIREGKPLSTFQASNQQVMIVSPSQVTTGMYEWADQILCATNARRNAINKTMRELKGFGPEPQEGDKIISLRNHWDDFSNNGNPLTNGSIGYLHNYSTGMIWLPPHINKPCVKVLYTGMTAEDGDEFPMLTMDYQALATGEKALTAKQEFQMNQSKRCPDAPYEFVYGYAITTHKAQGSEWDKVLLVEENFPFGIEEHKRWLYTGVTRASQKIVVVKKG